MSYELQNATQELKRKREKNGREPKQASDMIGAAVPDLDALREAWERGATKRGEIPTTPQDETAPAPQGQPVTLDTLDLSWHPKVKTAVNAAREWQKLRSWQVAENKRQRDANEEITVKPNASLVLLATAKDPVNCTGYGCGKTHIAKAVLWSDAFILDGKPFSPSGNFYESSRLIANLDGDTQPSAEIGGPILVIDDVGAEGMIPFIKQDEKSQAYERHARYFKAINYCYDKGVSVVITANLTTDQLAAHIGGRSWSRLLEMAPKRLIVDLTGVPDYRRKQGGR